MGFGTMTGQVTHGDTGAPVRGALVSLTPSDMRDVMRVGPDGSFDIVRLPEALTDERGQFELREVPAGRYYVTAAKTGFVSLQFGQRRPYQSGQPVQLAAAAFVEQVNVALIRGAVIGGRVLDENGEPMAGAAVRAVRQRFVGGRAELVSAGADVDLTDDQGEFRIHQLPPGTYVIEASAARLEQRPQEAVLTGRPTAGSHVTFYPSALSASDARPVQVGLGEEVLDRILMMRAPIVSAITVSVRAADGQPALNVSVRAYASLGMGGVGDVRTERRGDGSYAVPNLPPGSYAIEAEGADGTIARAQVRLDGGDVEVPLTLTAGTTLRGRVSFGPQRPPATLNPQSMRVLVRPADRDDLRMQEGAVVRSDWTFEIARLAGRARLGVIAPEGWQVQGIRIGDADVTDAVLDFSSGREASVDVVLTNRVTEVSGTVHDACGQVLPDASIVVFAVDRSKWGPYSRFVSLVRTNQDGRFTKRGLPPGRYFAVALEYLEDGEETNPELLAQLQPSATRVTLVEGETRTVELEMLGSRK